MSSSSTTSYTTAECNTIIRDLGRSVPRTCSCGAGIVIRMSRTSSNPGRHFFACPISIKHFFKWFDEALLEEVELLRDMLSDVRVHMGRLEVERKHEREIASEMINEAQSLKSAIVKLENAMEAVSAKASTYKHLKLTNIMLGCLAGVVFYCVLGCKCKTT